MEVILLEDIENLGLRFDTVSVKGGYGRNFLIPQKKAIVANRANKNSIAVRLQQVERKRAAELEEIQQLVVLLQGTAIQVGAKVGTTGKIFGSVTNVQLADAIKKKTGVELDRRKIDIKDEIKTLGTFSALIDLHRDVKHTMEFEVVAE